MDPSSDRSSITGSVTGSVVGASAHADPRAGSLPDTDAPGTWTCAVEDVPALHATSGTGRRGTGRTAATVFITAVTSVTVVVVTLLVVGYLVAIRPTTNAAHTYLEHLARSQWGQADAMRCADESGTARSDAAVLAGARWRREYDITGVAYFAGEGLFAEARIGRHRQRPRRISVHLGGGGCIRSVQVLSPSPEGTTRNR